MRLRTVGPRALCLLAVALVLPSAAPEASAQGIPAVYGAGHYRSDANGFPDPDGKMRSMSFVAVELNDETVLGRARLVNRASRTRLRVAIDCMAFSEDGSEAWMLGVVTRSSGPVEVGEWAVFGVKDNGRGRRAPADEMTPLFTEVDSLEILPFDHDTLCAILGGFFPIKYAAPIFPIERGNIRVKP